MRIERVATGGAVILYDASRSSNEAAALFDVDAWRAQGRLEWLRGGRAAVAFIDTGRGSVALRHYRRGGLVARVAGDRYLYTGEASTRPFAELRLLAALHDRGLPVPQPVAARFVRAGLTYTGDLITARLGDVTPLSARLAAGTLALDDWEAVGRCLARFHAAGVHHADLNAHNILLSDGGLLSDAGAPSAAGRPSADAAGSPVYLLDFDRGRLREPGDWHEQVLARLQRSLAKVSGDASPHAPWRAGYARLRAAHDAALVAS